MNKLLSSAVMASSLLLIAGTGFAATTEVQNSSLTIHSNVSNLTKAVDNGIQGIVLSELDGSLTNAQDITFTFTGHSNYNQNYIKMEVDEDGGSPLVHDKLLVGENKVSSILCTDAGWQAGDTQLKLDVKGVPTEGKLGNTQSAGTITSQAIFTINAASAKAVYQGIFDCQVKATTVIVAP